MTAAADRDTAVAPEPARESRRGKRRPWWLIVLAVACVVMVAYSLPAYIPPSPATSRIPIRNEFHLVMLVLHVFTASVATLAGVTQFWPWLRRRHPNVHRWTGRTYFFLGVFPAALFGIPVIVLAPFGASLQLGVAALEVMWVVTAVKGYRAVRQHRYADHRTWMIRSFALTTSVITSRVLFGLVLLVALPQMDTTYHGHATALTHDIASGSTWLALLAHVVYAEWYLRRRQSQRVVGRGTRTAL